MKIDEKGNIKWGKDEPSLRSCWLCNSSHEYLKKANYPILCFSCGRILIHGKILQESKNDEEARELVEKMYEQKNGVEVTQIKSGEVTIITDNPEISKHLKRRNKK